MRQIVLDTETTGLSTEQGHRIIEVGCVEIQSRAFTGSTFHYYINPERDIDPGAQQVHGITSEFLSDKPKFHEIADAFIEYVQGAELIIHNAKFDIGFLDYELGLLGRYKKLKEYCKVLDTLELARKKHPGQRNNLDALSKRYQVDTSKRTFHGALLDSEILGEVYLEMTAGQIDFLTSQSAAKKTSATQTQSAQNEKREKLIVLKAKEDELKKHQAFMAKLQGET